MKNIYKRRPKINPKVIFSCVNQSMKNALIIGENNSDNTEVLKTKNINVEEFKSLEETCIIDFLMKLEKAKFDLIILNLELCDFIRIKKIINLLIEKGNYAVIRFRSKEHGKFKISKKYRINKIIKINNISILEKFYAKKNYISKNVFFKPFSYYTVYLLTKNEPVLNLELSFFDKLKRFLFSGKEIKFLMNKK